MSRASLTAPRWLLSVLAAVLALALVPVAATRAEAAELSPPTGLRAISTSRNAISLSWTAVKGAPRYRVQYSTSSSMSNATYVRVTGTQLDLKGLKSSKAYYIKVRVITSSGANLSSYSRAIKVTTRSSGSYSHLAPVGLKAEGVTDLGMTLKWASRGSGIRYRIAYSTSSSFSGAVYRRFTPTSAALTGLKPAKTYYFKVRVINADGDSLSSYSPAIKVTTATPTATYAAPTNLTINRLAQTAAALSWTAVKGAPAYRIEASTSSSFTDPITRQLTGTATSTEFTGLAKGKTYYLRMAAVTVAGVRAGAYSATVKGATPTEAADLYLTPTGLKVVSKLATRAGLTWNSRGTGLQYQVRYAADPEWADAQTVTSTGTAVTITGLKETTRYYLQVRVVSAGGDAQSRFGPSPAVELTTAETDTVQLTVASYNVKCTNCYAGAANEGTWYQRRGAVVNAIVSQAPDVIGIQEASQGWLKDSKGNPISLSQFEDLEDRLGAPYKVTNSHRNNCVRSTTPSSCVYKDQGASQGTKIFYNTSVLKLLKQGSRRFSELRSSDNDRYVAWAIFEDNRNGQQFFFANTHLEHVSDVSGQTKWFNLRVTQTRQMLETINANNPDKLPTFVVGDLNSSKRSIPANGPYDTLLAAGYVDPLGNYYQSTSSTRGATVEKRIRTNFNSFNGFRRLAPSVSWVNAANIDYIFTTPRVRVLEWETSVNIDASGNFVGQIPSDHNLVRATVELPVTTPQN